MRIHSKRRLIVLLLIAGTPAATGPGGPMGLLWGYACAPGNTGAFCRPAVPNVLHNHQPGVSVAFVESEPDGMIVAHVGVDAQGKPPFAGLARQLMDPGRADLRLCESVAAHRSEYPALGERAEIRSRVEFHPSAMRTEFGRPAS